MTKWSLAFWAAGFVVLCAAGSEDDSAAADARIRLESKLNVIYGADMPAFLRNVRFERAGWRNRQEYSIDSDGVGVVLRACDPMGFAYAAAGLLHELGYRRFAPHPSWEIVPMRPLRRLDVHRRERPHYRYRRIWSWISPEQMKGTDHDEWNFANRMIGEVIQTSHIYELFVRTERRFFDEHPECLALVGGERKSDKLCISNPLLRERFVQFELEQLERAPNEVSVSAEPSDGGGWCECEECRRIGTPSDRAVYLANEVARSVRAKFPGRVVGLYAYNMHSPPPNIPVERGVVAFVATAFLRDGWTVDRLVDEWGKRTYVGIREYYYATGLPGCGCGTDTSYLAKSIPAFYRANAHWLNAEANDSWIPALMGFNVAAALMWDISTDPESVKVDVVARSFPSCQGAARRFFDMIDGGSRRPVCEDLFARMYEALDAAWRQAKSGSDGERLRLRQLVAYTLFAERLNEYYGNPGEQTARAFLEVAAALRPYHAIPTNVYRRDGRQFGSPATALANLWDWDSPRDLPDAGETICAGLSRNRKIDFQPVDFGTEASVRRNLSGAKATGCLRPLRNNHSFYLWSDGSPFDLEVTGGLIAHYRDRGNVKLTLIQVGGASETGELETMVQHDESAPPDGVRHVVRLTPSHAGLHRLEVSDGNDQTLYAFPRGMSVAVFVEREKSPRVDGTFFFYVPKGARKLGFYASTSRGEIVGPDGEAVAALSNRNGYAVVDVPKGMDGKVWTVSEVEGVFRPLTAPPWLNLDPLALLVPRACR